MGLEVYFNDIPFHENMLVLGVKRSILPPRSNFSKKVPSQFGENYTGYTYNPKKITVKAFLEAEDETSLQDSLSIIADYLNVSEPCKLVISDEPDKYVWAVPEGDINPSLVAGANAEFDIPFICYDVYKYANEVELFEADEQNIVSITNSGSVEAFPTVSVNFTGQANFLQATSYTGETVLIGQRPSVDKENSTGNKVVMVEPCELMDNFSPAGNVVDQHGEVTGTVAVNSGGYGIYCKDFGQATTKQWHGAAVRRNIGKNVTDFRFGVSITHDSRGDVKGIGVGSKPPVATGSNSVKYKVKASPSLNIRTGRGTNFKKVGSIPNNKEVMISDVASGWGKVTYNNVTGYVSMTYLTKVVASASTSSKAIVSTGDVYVRSGAGTNYKALTVAKKGTKATILDTKNGWYKVTVNGKTGYSSGKYWKKDTTAKKRSVRAVPSAESKLGRIEVYGFDQNGNKLFRCLIRDDQKYHEYTKPEIYIGNKLVLSDNKATPTARKGTVTENGKQVTRNVDSGKYGDWNEFSGNFYITRQTNSHGNHQWTVEIYNMRDGKTVKEMKKSNLVNTNDFPTGDLNHIVVWFAQHTDNPVVDAMSVNHLQVTELNKRETIKNFPIFEEGDNVVIDFENHEITLNDIPFMKELDIGSEFFSVPTGDSEFIIHSDNEELEIEVGLVNRWL